MMTLLASASAHRLRDTNGPIPSLVPTLASLGPERSIHQVEAR
jgi:hypothetical protein